MTREAMIARMRLQWWRDALLEISGGGLVRRHEVVVPLAGVIDATGAAMLDRVVVARHRDLEPVPFDDEPALADYLRETSGVLFAVAARAMGANPADQAAHLAAGQAAGMAAYLRAVPALVAAGRHPLPDGRAATLRGHADQYRQSWGDNAGRLPAPVRLLGWTVPGVLARASRDPEAIGEGRLSPGPIRSAVTLALRAGLG